MTDELPIYKIYGHEWYRDKKLLEYRMVNYPMVHIPMDDGDRLVNDPSYVNKAIRNHVDTAMRMFGELSS